LPTLIYNIKINRIVLFATYLRTAMK